MNSGYCPRNLKRKMITPTKELDTLRPARLAWFVLYTHPRAEKQVEARLRQQGFDVWLPLHRTPRTWSDRIKYVDMPLFNSYIFIHTTPENLFSATRTYGVARIVYFDSRPAEMRQSEIDAIREFLSLADSRELMPGDEVEILCGAMKSITGRVRKVKKRYVLLYLEQLGATVCVDTAKVARVANKGENG